MYRTIALRMFGLSPGKGGKAEADAMEQRFQYMSDKPGRFTQTTTDSGFGGDKLALIVTFRLVHEGGGVASDKSCSWSLWSRAFFLAPLFDLFAEAIGESVSSLVFLHEGRQLTRESSPASCGFLVGSQTPNIIDVYLSTSSAAINRRVLRTLTRMAKVPVRAKPTSAWGGLVAKGLQGSVIFRCLSLVDVLECAAVSTLWHAASCAYAMSFQLSQGGAETDIVRFTDVLELAKKHTRLAEPTYSQAWRGLSMSKEAKRTIGGAFTFEKGAGCTRMKTCAMLGPSPSFAARWSEVMEQRTAFFSCLESNSEEKRPASEKTIWYCEPAASSTTTPVKPSVVIPTTTLAEDNPIPPPPQGAKQTGQIVMPTTPAQKQEVVAMFRSYFSPDMYYIFPLIVERVKFGVLDFRNCSTWIVLGKDNHISAALSWRLHKRNSKAAVAEVLFIATWEELRGEKTGADLVEALENVARREGVSMLYVEVGHEQPLAELFWGKNNGFHLVVQPALANASIASATAPNASASAPNAPKRQPTSKVAANASKPPGNASSTPTFQAKTTVLDDRMCLYLDSSCLRFTDTRQFVKLL